MDRDELGQLKKQALTRRHFVRLCGTLVGTSLLAACTSPDAPNDEVVTSEATGVSAEVSSAGVQRVEPSVAVVESSEQAQSFAQESIRLVNQARNQAGLESLSENAVLMQVAMSYSQRMAAEGFYGHDDPQGKQASDRIAAAGYLAQMSAENIARGQPDAATVVEGWLNSPGHRANIMNPELREIGAGYAYTDADDYRHYWTHVFATPDASVGRDLTLYPEQVLEQINLLRQQAGIGSVARDATLESITTNHLKTLMQAESYSTQVEPTLNAASQEAVQTFAQVMALSAAGPATPEAVVAQWAETRGAETQGNNGSPIIDTTFRAAGVAYVFIEQDEYRHYWLLLLGS